MSRPRSHLVPALGALLLLAARPVALFACSACYGDPNSAMANGLTWAITVLVGVVACVLAGVVAFFVQASRRMADDKSHSPRS